MENMVDLLHVKCTFFSLVKNVNDLYVPQTALNKVPTGSSRLTLVLNALFK